MDFELPQEIAMLAGLVRRFVENELLPLEPRVLEREARRLGPEVEAFATEAASALIDHAVQAFGAMGSPRRCRSR